ncbi:MAG: molecular chaperone DnaJ [Myxococcota bacterium]
MKRDYYEVLEIAREASDDEIKKAYRKLAIKLHPDRNPDDPQAEEQFKEATEAYAVLSDRDKRRRYDRLGHAAFEGSSGGPGGFEQVDFSTVTELLEGLLGDVLSGRRSRKSRAARDVEQDLEITFEEAALGTEKSISISRPAPCRSCNATGVRAGSKIRPCAVCAGRGQIKQQRGFFASMRPCEQCRGTGHQLDDPCPECSGTGSVVVQEEFVVRLPAGVADGAVRTVRGAGEHSGNDSGDLHLHIRVQTHALFDRDGADVKLTMPISFPQAVLGSTLDVPTLYGKVTMRLPSGTPSGKMFRLRGKGIDVLGGYGKGDQLVRVVIEVPEQVTPRQRRLLEELSTEMNAETQPKQRSFMEKIRSLFEQNTSRPG